jgi:hypothetical protein
VADGGLFVEDWGGCETMEKYVFFFRLHHSVDLNEGKTKIRIPILLGYASFYIVYYKDIVKFQILYLQDIC